MFKLFRISEFLALAVSVASLAPCDTLSITISGMGSGTFGDQTFANAAFQFTFFTSDTANVTSAPCCTGVRTTPIGTAGSVTIADVGSGVMDAAGDQAVFVNPAASAAGIWHYNSPDFLTVANPALAHYDLTDTIAPVTGKTFFYATPLRMSDARTTLYFTSVSDVSFSVQRRPGGGKPSVVSVSPDSATIVANTPTQFTFVVSDAAGTGDLRGMNIFFSDPPPSAGIPSPFGPYEPYACWIWYQRSAKMLSLFGNPTLDLPDGGWQSFPIGPSGGVLHGPRCVIDTTMATVQEAGDFLTLTLPISIGNPRILQYYPAAMPITMNAINNANVDTGYQHAGQVTLNPTSGPGFAIITTPDFRDVAVGSPATWKLNVVSWGGFSDVVTFSAALPFDAPYTFDPATITGSGTTTLTLSTEPLRGKTESLYQITVFGKTSSAVFNRVIALAVETGPPTVNVTDYSVGGPDHYYGVEALGTPGNLDALDVNGLNVLIGSALDGRNACWLFTNGNALWLASDDGLTWTLAGPHLAAPAGNSQCTIQDSSMFLLNSNIELGLHIVFKPGFSEQDNKVFLRVSTVGGFDTGYILANVKRP